VTEQAIPIDLSVVPLSDRLVALEATIAEGLAHFVQVGSALMEIRDARLYQERGYRTFEDYADQQWGMSRPRAYQLIDGARVVRAVSTSVDTSPVLPVREAQTRPLAALARADEAAAGRAWQLAQLIANGPAPTGEEVSLAVKLHDGLDALTEEVRTSLLEEAITRPTGGERAAVLAVAVTAPSPAPRPVRADPLPIDIPDVRLEVADATSLPLGDESVDLIVTSPPYGLDKPYAGSADLADGGADFTRDWLAEAWRVARPGGRLALNVPLDTTKPVHRSPYAEAYVAALVAGWTFRFAIVWNENNITRSVARGSVDSATAPHVIARVEMILVFHKGEWHRDRPCPDDLEHEEWLDWTNGLWTFPGESRPWEGHPAPFPEELPRRLIKLLSFPGDTVLDPFVGSGTTAVVAQQLGRQMIGFDLAPEYVAATRRRLLRR
jgi:site-specific DNA-methyltransferase (adenine-specific)